MNAMSSSWTDIGLLSDIPVRGARVVNVHTADHGLMRCEVLPRTRQVQTVFSGRVTWAESAPVLPEASSNVPLA